MRYDNVSTKMLIRLWNGENEDWEILTVNVPDLPTTGPSDDYLVVNESKVEPDNNGNFIRNDYSEDELDAVHAYAVARLSIGLWENATGKKIVWPWNSDHQKSKLNIVLHSGLLDASFRPSAHSILFGKINFESMPTCRSFDVVSHETTHAIIESLRPGIHEKANLEAFAVIEAIADLTPILLLLSIPSTIEKALNLTSNDLSQRSFLTEFAEGYSLQKDYGIRSALEVKVKSENPCDIGSLITKTAFVHIVKAWNRSTNPKNFHDIIKQLTYAILNSFMELDTISPDYFLKKLSRINYGLI